MTKPAPNGRREIITIRATADQKVQLVAKAVAANMNLSEYILSICASTQQDEMTTELLETRLGLSAYTLDVLYSEVDTMDLKSKTAQALATLDPDGLEWYGQNALSGNIWTNTPQAEGVNANSRALRKLVKAIFTEEDRLATTSEPKWLSMSGAS